jgi:hypothetical protein
VRTITPVGRVRKSLLREACRDRQFRIINSLRQRRWQGKLADGGNAVCYQASARNESGHVATGRTRLLQEATSRTKWYKWNHLTARGKLSHGDDRFRRYDIATDMRLLGLWMSATSESAPVRLEYGFLPGRV